MKDEVNISRPCPIGPHKLSVTRRPLRFRVARKHALDAEAHALDVLDRGPASRGQQIQTDNAVGIDVGMQGDGARGLVQEQEHHFWRF